MMDIIFQKLSQHINDLGDNKIDLFYKVDLGERAKISKISFIGDKKFQR